MFARLEPLGAARVLDLYAGSGALGIEALSRGAAEACFVERAGAAAECILGNLAALGLEEVATVLRSDVLRAIPRLAREGQRFGLILADPPYASGDAARVAEAVARHALLTPDGLLVIESDRRHPPGRIAGLREVDERRAGDTLISRYAGVAPGESEPGPRDRARARRQTRSDEERT